MSDQPRLLPCPFCDGRAKLVDVEEENAIAIQCLGCGAGSPLGYSVKDDATGVVVDAWNRRDGLLPALRVVRERCIQIIRDDMGVPVFAGAAATWIWRRLNDAALLELAGIKGGDANSGDRRSNSPDMNEAGAECNAPSAGGVPENTGPAPASSLPYAEYAPLIKQAAEPDERVVHIGGTKLDERHEGRREDCSLCKAAEPAERQVKQLGCLNCGGYLERHGECEAIAWAAGEHNALLDAARDLRIMAKGLTLPGGSPWKAGERAGVELAALRLEGKA